MYFYYVASDLSICVRVYSYECTYVTVVQFTFVHMCEVGAAERYHKLVGHSSAANQRSKWL